MARSFFVVLENDDRGTRGLLRKPSVLAIHLAKEVLRQNPGSELIGEFRFPSMKFRQLKRSKKDEDESSSTLESGWPDG